MGAALDWSHDLLGEPERGLFRRLSVFAGGFSLEAAESVGAEPRAVGDGSGPEEVLDLLGALVEQSLVLAEVGGGPTRYRMLEPVRQYALRRLEESGEAEETRRRHAAFYLALAEAVEPKLKGADQAGWLDRLEQEHDSLRAALGWLLERGDAEAAAHFSYSLYVFWWIRGYHTEGRRWTEATLAAGSDQRAALLLGAAQRIREGGGAAVYTYRPEHSLQERTVGTARAQLGEPGFGEAWARGEEMSFEQAVEYALGSGATRRDSVSP